VLPAHVAELSGAFAGAGGVVLSRRERDGWVALEVTCPAMYDASLE